MGALRRLVNAGRRVPLGRQDVPVRILSPVNIRRVLGVGENCGVFISAASSVLDLGVTVSFSRGRGRRGEGLMEVNMSTTAASTRTPVKAPAWAAAMRRFNSYLVNDFGGGPRPWKLAWVINFQKVGTFPFLGFLIAWYHNPSTSA
jgi:hypothetical protein